MKNIKRSDANGPFMIWAGLKYWSTITVNLKQNDNGFLVNFMMISDGEMDFFVFVLKGLMEKKKSEWMAVLNTWAI